MIYDNSQLVINDKGEVIIPDGVTQIANDTGSRNPLIKKVIIPGSVEDIRNRVFEGCPRLEQVVFEHNYAENKQWNGSGILRDCPKLKKVYFADFDTFDAYSYDTGGPLDNGSELYINGKQVVDFIIPEKLQSGRHHCIRNLHGATGIKSVHFEDGSEVIGYSYEINNEHCLGTHYGITKRGFEDIAFSKYPEATANMKIRYFNTPDEFVSMHRCDSIITAYEDFEKECIESMHSISPRKPQRWR